MNIQEQEERDFCVMSESESDRFDAMVSNGTDDKYEWILSDRDNRLSTLCGS